MMASLSGGTLHVFRYWVQLEMVYLFHYPIAGVVVWCYLPQLRGGKRIPEETSSVAMFTSPG